MQQLHSTVTVAGVPLDGYALMRILRPGEAAALLGRSKISLYRDIASGKLPPWIQLGPGAVGQHLGVLLKSYGMLPEEAEEAPE